MDNNGELLAQMVYKRLGLTPGDDGYAEAVIRISEDPTYGMKNIPPGEPRGKQKGRPMADTGKGSGLGAGNLNKMLSDYTKQKKMMQGGLGSMIAGI